MLRGIVFFLSCLSVSACVSVSAPTAPQLLAQAEAEAKLNKDIDMLSAYAVAKYAGLTAQPETAARNYSRLLRTVRDDPWLAEQAVYSILRVGEVERAISLTRKLPRETIDQTELPRLLLSAHALKNGRTEETLSYLTLPWSNDYHAMLARSLAAWAVIEEDSQAAIRLQQQAGGQDGLYALMGQTLGAIMREQTGDVERARRELQILWDVNSRFAFAVQAEAQLMALAGEKENALGRLRAFYQDVGRHPVLIKLAADIENDNVSARPVYSPTQGAALAFYVATAPQAAQGYGDTAGVYFAISVYLDPQMDSAKALWADTLDRANRRSEAITILKTISERSVHHTSAQGQLAWALRREGRDDEALQVARSALARTDNRNIRVQLADLLQSMDRDGEAEAAFTEVINADEARGVYDWRLYFARGSARERLGEWPRAENDLKTALNLNPDNPSILNYLGYSWIDRGINLEDGLDLIEQALRLAPNNGAITDSLGWAHYKLGNYERAVFYLERATELSPDVAEILDHLGDAYWQVGRFKEAGFQWQRALQYTSNQSEIDLLQRKLDGGIALLQAATEGYSPAYP